MKGDRFSPLTGSITIPISVLVSASGMMIHAIAARQCTVKVKFPDTIICMSLA